MSSFGKPLKDVPEAISVDYVVGLKQTAPGVFQVVQIDQALLTGGGSAADLNVVRDRVTAVEGGKADKSVLSAAIVEPPFTPLTRSLWNPSRSQNNKIVDTVTGAIIDAAGYVTNAGIPVAPGQSLVASEVMARVCYRNEAGTRVGAVISGTAIGTALTVPAGAAYVDISATVTGNPNVNSNIRVYPLAALPTYRVDFGWTDTETARRLGHTTAIRAVKALSPTQPLNLFNKNAVSTGYALGATGGPYAAAGYNVSPFIPLDPDSAQFILRNGPGANALSYYRDADVTAWLSAATVTSSTATTPPAEARWVRFQIADANLATQQMAWGATLPAASLAFGYVTSSYVDTTALTSARATSAAARDEAANVMNPADISRDTAISAVNGATYAAAGYGTTGFFEVNPGDYIAISAATNAMIFADAAKGYLGSTTAASFTAQIAGNVMTVSAVASGTITDGNRVSGSGVANGRVLLQLSGAPGAAGTYLMDVAQTVATDTAMTCTQGIIDANTWVKVPAGAYFARLQCNPVTTLLAATVRQGRAARVRQASFTADVSGTSMTVTAIASGTGKIVVGDRVIGPGLTPALITSAPAGGGLGVYTLAVAQPTLSGVTAYSGADPTVYARAYGGANGGWQPLAGKKIVFLGDSIYYTGGLIPYVLAGTGAALAANHSRPGRRMKDALYSWDGTTATALTASVFTSADAVDIGLGTNDWSGNAPLGTIADCTTSYAGAPGTSFYNDVFAILYQIRQWAPTIRIFIATPLKRGVVAGQPTYPGVNAGGFTLEQYAQAIREVAELFATPVIDQLTRSGFSPYNIAALASDQLHPSTPTAHQMQAAVHIGVLNAA